MLYGGLFLYSGSIFQLLLLWNGLFIDFYKLLSLIVEDYLLLSSLHFYFILLELMWFVTRTFASFVTFFLVGLKEQLDVVVSRALEVELIRKALAFLAKRYFADNIVVFSTFFYEWSEFSTFFINLKISDHFFLDNNLLENRLFDFSYNFFHYIYWDLYYFLYSPLTSLVHSLLYHFHFFRRGEFLW